MDWVLSSEPEINKLNRRLREICKGIPIESGEIQRLAHQYLARFRIEITGRNLARLRKESRESYRDEWARGTAESNLAIGRAIETIGLGQGDMELNRGAAELLVDILLGMDNGRRWFNIADLGAGTGNTTDAVLEVMGRDPKTVRLAQRCTFYLVEPSPDRLADAKETASRNSINDKLKKNRMRLKCTPKCDTLEHFLDSEQSKHLDAVICSGVLHHCTFPEHFDMMYKALTDDGVLVIGDWHNNLFSHPANLIGLLARLGVCADRIRDYKLLFNVTEQDAKEFEMGLGEGDRIANNYFADFIVAMANELRYVEQRSRLFFFEALESLPERVEKIQKAGFETDIDELRAKHKGFARIADPSSGNLVRPAFPRTNVACVVGAAKIPAGRTHKVHR